MFSLIIAIVSIALVTALALATVYYGGSAFKQGAAKANAAQFINEAQQINGAAQAYNAVSGNTAVSLTDLITSKYPTSAPNAGWQILDGAIFNVLPEDSCLAANKTMGIELIPGCGDPAYAGKEYCCSHA